jgi:AraC-like DNA-binding protein
MPPEAERYFLQRSFSDLDELHEIARGWDLDFRPLEAARSGSELLQIGEGNTLFTRFRAGVRLDQQGGAPPGTRTFAVLEDGVTGVRWCGHELNAHTVAAFASGGGFDATSGPEFRVYTFSVLEETLAQVAHALGLPEPEDLLGHTEQVFVCLPPSLEALRRRMRRMSERVRRDPESAGQPGLRHELGFELPARILGAVAAGGKTTPKLDARRSNEVLESALALIRQSPHEPLTVRGLSRAAGASERTLRYAFSSRYGVPPKAYLKAVRLHGVRRELRSADPQTARVADTANHWGFWHMGDFAADYRRLFGELPSKTLARRARL